MNRQKPHLLNFYCSHFGYSPHLQHVPYAYTSMCVCTMAFDPTPPHLCRVQATLFVIHLRAITFENFFFEETFRVRAVCAIPTSLCTRLLYQWLTFTYRKVRPKVSSDMPSTSVNGIYISFLYKYNTHQYPKSKNPLYIRHNRQ